MRDKGKARGLDLGPVPGGGRYRGRDQGPVPSRPCSN